MLFLMDDIYVRKNGKFKKIAQDLMKFRKNIIWNVGCKIFMKKEKYIKMEGQRSFGGENLNFEKDSK
jgi:hypothetical protein